MAELVISILHQLGKKANGGGSKVAQSCYGSLRLDEIASLYEDALDCLSGRRGKQLFACQRNELTGDQQLPLEVGFFAFHWLPDWPVLGVLERLALEMLGVHPGCPSRCSSGLQLAGVAHPLVARRCAYCEFPRSV